MVDYIRQYIEGVRKNREFYTQFINEVVTEWSKLEPQDFEPAVQQDVVRLRALIRLQAESQRTDDNKTDAVLADAVRVLGYYRGVGSGGVARSFSFVADAALRGIIERDYAELLLKLYPSNAWKSTVIMAGSILEAILFDRLGSAKWSGLAGASKEVPKDKKTGVAWPMDKWHLEHLINIAVDIKALPKDPADTIHQVLRDFRNFVHPKKEIRAAHACTDAEGMLAVGALKSVCNYLEKNP